jgi:hypothetical protein
LKRALHQKLWDEANEEWILRPTIVEYVGSIFSEESAQGDGNSNEPIDQESVALFRELLEFNDQPEFGTMEVSLIWHSKESGVELLTRFIEELNLEVVAQERSRLMNQNDYLVNELSSESREPIRMTLLSIMQLNSEKLASMVSDEYAFVVLDPAVEPLKRYAPNRTRIVLGWVAIVTLMYGAWIFFLYLRLVGRRDS